MLRLKQFGVGNYLLYFVEYCSDFETPVFEE